MKDSLVLKDDLKLLKEKMTALEVLQEYKKEKTEVFTESIQSILTEIDEVEEEVNRLKDEVITPKALALFEETGNKKMEGGIGIRETTVLDYDKDKALKWAKEKQMFLNLDKKAFEKAADSLGLDFVETKKIPKVTFPKVIKIEG